MPAAAVIPAPEAYTHVVAAKKLVAGFLHVRAGPPAGENWCFGRASAMAGLAAAFVRRAGAFTRLAFHCQKIRVFKAGSRPAYSLME